MRAEKRRKQEQRTDRTNRKQIAKWQIQMPQYNQIKCNWSKTPQLKDSIENSLAVQRIGLHAFNSRARCNFWSGNWDAASCVAQPKKKDSIVRLDKTVRPKYMLPTRKALHFFFKETIKLLFYYYYYYFFLLSMQYVGS